MSCNAWLNHCLVSVKEQNLDQISESSKQRSSDKKISLSICFYKHEKTQVKWAWGDTNAEYVDSPCIKTHYMCRQQSKLQLLELIDDWIWSQGAGTSQVVQANSFHFAVKVSKRQVLAQQCCGAGWRAKQQQLSFWLLQNIPERNEGRSSRKLWKSWVCKFNNFASYWFNCCYNKEMGRLVQILLYDFVYFLEFTCFD